VIGEGTTKDENKMQKTSVQSLIRITLRVRELHPQWREAKKRFDAAPRDNASASKAAFGEAHQQLHGIETELDTLFARFDDVIKGIDISHLEAAVDLANAVRTLQS
jgi:hypothetical protein